MTTPAPTAAPGTEPSIVHPLSLRGPARRWWLTARLASTVTILIVIAMLAWFTAGASVDIPTWAMVFIAGAVLAAPAGARRLRWMAWAHVPGAHRRYQSQQEADQALPSHRGHRALVVVNDALFAAGGVALVIGVGTEFAHDLVGILGAVMLGYLLPTTALRILRHQLRDSGAVLVAICGLLAAAVWAWAGWTSVTVSVTAYVLIVVLAFKLVRWAAWKTSRAVERLDDEQADRR